SNGDAAPVLPADFLRLIVIAISPAPLPGIPLASASITMDHLVIGVSCQSVSTGRLSKPISAPREFAETAKLNRLVIALSQIPPQEVGTGDAQHTCIRRACVDANLPGALSLDALEMHAR